LVSLLVPPFLAHSPLKPASQRNKLAIMGFARKALKILNPVAEKENDGRDVWPNRAAFILAAIVSTTANLGIVGPRRVDKPGPEMEAGLATH
jgi:hypothetical protein